MSFISKISNMFGRSSGASATKASSKVARERLSVILASQRGSEMLDGVDMTLLQQDVLEVVQKHIQAVAKNKPVQFNVKNDGDVDLFEMQVELSSQRGGRNGSGSTIAVGVSTTPTGN